MRISDWSSDVCSSDLKFLLLPTALVETDESRLVPSGIFAQAADCNHRVEHGHVGAERDRGRFLGRVDDPHLLREGAVEAGDDHADDRIGYMFAALEFDILLRRSRRLCGRGEWKCEVWGRGGCVS